MPSPDCSMRDLLIRAGQALYGREWVSPLARELGVSLRTMTRWKAGTYGPSETTWQRVRGEIRDMLLRRKEQVSDLGQEIDDLIRRL